MDTPKTQTLPKRERIYRKADIDRLLSFGRFRSVGALRYTYAPLSGLPYNRIMVAVPKKLFKRAVKRNLLKRRLREAWRRLRVELGELNGVDVFLVYSSKDILSQGEINSLVVNILGEIRSREEARLDRQGQSGQGKVHPTPPTP